MAVPKTNAFKAASLLAAVNGKKLQTYDEWVVERHEQLREASGDAIAYLLRVLSDDSAPHGARVNAANSILDRAGVVKQEQQAVAQRDRQLSADEQAEAVELAERIVAGRRG
jgi:hypothetical protein